MTVIEVNNISKQYRLGVLSAGSLSHDLNRWWQLMRGQEDPYLKVTESNQRNKLSTSDYVWALREINFTVKQGEVLGVVGKNGAGKSTLLKILSRITSPTIGTINVKGRMASLLEVGTGFHPELTGKENIFLNGSILGMRKQEIQQKLNEIIAFSGIEKYIDTPVKRYSSGMYVRLAFAVAAYLEPEILVIDEVLAVGDAEFQRKSIGKMEDVAKQGRTVLYVSHNMDSVNKLCNRCLYLKDGEVADMGSAEKITQKYLEDTSLEKKFSPYSSEVIKVKSISFQDQNNKASNLLRSFEAITITINGEAYENLTDISFALCFDNFQEKRVVSLWSEYLGKRFNLPKGEFTFKIQVPSLHLISGEYSTVLYFERKGIELLRVDNFSRFYVNFTNNNGIIIEPAIYHGAFAEQFDMQLLR